MKNTKVITTCILLAFQAVFLFGQPYQRVVSLAPSITKNIYQLNARQKLVGCTNYCFPASEQGVAVVASPVAVNLEQVLSVRPDLVMVTTITNPETIEMLRKLGIQVEVFSTPKNFDQICEQYVRMGKLLGKEQEALVYIAEVTKQVESIRVASKKYPRERVFFQIGADPLFTVIPNTFMNDYITGMNGINIAAGQSRGTITRERVLSSNPDQIFIVTMGILGAEQRAEWQAYKELSAVKKNKLFIIDSDMACTPTPQTFLQTLQTMQQLLHH